jgi:hypothetical protein
VPHDREVVDRDDERDGRVDRRALRGAVEDVDVVTPRLRRERAQVPADVANRPDGPTVAAERVPPQFEVGLALQAGKEPRDVSGDPGFRQGQRRDVEGDAHS